MNLLITIDVASPVPAFEQIRAQLATLISTGALTNGQRLPTVRQLARDLDLAPGTVGRAFRELEQAGLVRARGARGTTVTGPADSAVPPQTAERLHTLTKSYLATAHALGYDGEVIRAAVKQCLLAQP